MRRDILTRDILIEEIAREEMTRKEITKKDVYIDFGSIVPVSTIDWSGRSSCVIFFNKCPLKCIWCQNYKLLKNTNIIDINIVKSKICDVKRFISSIVFSGGEPTFQYDALYNLIRFAKKQGLYVGIQTSGYYPLVIKKLIDKGILDKIFLDMKASPLDAEKYKLITGSDDAHKKVVESFKIINTSSVESEIRTTVFRPFIDDVFDIAKFLSDNNYRGVYILQTGIPQNVPEGNMRKEIRIESDEMRSIAKKIMNDMDIIVKYGQ